MKNCYPTLCAGYPKGPGLLCLKLIFLCLTTCFFCQSGYTQQDANATYTRSYLNNLVEIGLSDYGIITGEDSMHLYFIAVRETKHERILNSLKSVKFYGTRYRAKATKVSEIRFDNYTVVLYQSIKPTENDWRRHYFFSLDHKKGRLSTFRDKWLSDKIWAVFETKIEVLKAPKTGSTLYTLKLPLEAGVARGMPLINNEGFMAGVFAESTLGKKIVKAIDMKDIVEALYTLGENTCRYVDMVEWGHTDTRCALEMLAKEAAEEKARMEAEAKLYNTEEPVLPEVDTTTAKKNKKGPRAHFIDFGINANVMAAPLLANNPDKDNYFGTRSFHAGLSVHFNIDKRNLNRITLKPRYGSFYERNDGNLWASPGEDVRILISSYQYVEMPVVLERQLFSAGNYSIAIGAGYSPAWVFNHEYKWVDKTATSYSTTKVKGNGSSPLMHRLLGELYLYESKSLRLGAVYMHELTGYPNKDYQLSVNGVDHTPFADRKKSWYLGVELGIRFGGKWGQRRTL